ncbi:Modification methylase FokI [subsurface metagenome]
MKFIGNKFRLLDFIEFVLKDNNISNGTFMDLFAGTANVGKYFKKLGFKIISTDILDFSYAFQRSYIKVTEYPKFNNLELKGIKLPKENLFDFKTLKTEKEQRIEKLKEVIFFLNKLKGKEGFIYNNYCEGGTKNKKYKRRYFSDSNAMRIDAIRECLQKWEDGGKITEDEFYILLAELIDRSDYVANNSGTYGAYLKIWRSMALKPLILKMPEIIESEKEHEVFKMDANKLVKIRSCDVAYIDPPYNARQYATNYHLLETITCLDNPAIYGKTGMRPYENKKSAYSMKSLAPIIFAELIDNLKSKHILVSYNNEGIISKKNIIDILKNKGELKIYKKDYRRFRSESDHENRKYKVPENKTKEYIYYCGVKK